MKDRARWSIWLECQRMQRTGKRELQSEWKGKRRGNKMAEGSGEKKEGAREKKESLFEGTGERIIREKEQE